MAGKKLTKGAKQELTNAVKRMNRQKIKSGPKPSQPSPMPKKKR